ncbi:hypothetical protein TWF696_003479 [Orbilia brochopaga]|uniref:Uncharacterized protein n=1 Tax=Orbilia brochopaga TaxID=3140254 RepID=A0AAV9TX23_9PEZI
MMIWLVPLLLVATPASAYSFLFLRELRPDHFRSPNYVLTTSPLTIRIPGECYALDSLTDLGNFDVAVIYNGPGETPITGLAAYTNRQCGEQLEALPQNPAFVITLDPDSLYGIHIVRLRDLGINYAGGSVKGISVTEEEKPGGLLEGAADLGTPISSLYVWESSPTSGNAPQRRVYLADVVEQVPEPTDLLERLSGSIAGGVYLNDLVERYLLPTDAAPIEDVVTPWIRRLFSGQLADLSAQPFLQGPLYDTESEGEREIVQQAGQDRGREILVPTVVNDETIEVIVRQPEQVIQMGQPLEEVQLPVDIGLNNAFRAFINEDESQLGQRLLRPEGSPLRQQARQPSVEELLIEYPPLPRLQQQQIPRLPPFQQNTRRLSEFAIPRSNSGRRRRDDNLGSRFDEFGRSREEEPMEEEPMQNLQNIAMNLEDADESIYDSPNGDIPNLYSNSNLQSPQRNNLPLSSAEQRGQINLQDIDLSNRVILQNPINQDLIETRPRSMTSTVRRPEDPNIPGLGQQQGPPTTSAQQQRHELDFYLANESENGNEESGFTDVSGMNSGSNPSNS